MERLQNSALRLAEYKNTHSILSKGQASYKKRGMSIWDLPELRKAKKRSPPLAFLVPAVLEAILDSTFADKTLVSITILLRR
jgi:hypothetical protein